MYPTDPPTRATFNPKIPNLAIMPSPPSPLRALVHRLNTTPVRRQKVTTSLKIKIEPGTEAKTRPTSISSSSTDQTPSFATQRSLLMSKWSNTTPTNSSASSDSMSTSSSTSSNSPNNNDNINNQPALFLALTNLLQSQLSTPTSNPRKPQTLFFDFADFADSRSRIEIHVHIHPTLRPAFPTPGSLSRRLKRKRGDGCGEFGDGGDRDREGRRGEEGEEAGRDRVESGIDGMEVECEVELGRRKKKVKLSHGFDCLSRGAGDVGGVGGSGIRTRLRTTNSRRFSMRNRR